MRIILASLLMLSFQHAGAEGLESLINEDAPAAKSAPAAKTKKTAKTKAAPVVDNRSEWVKALEKKFGQALKGEQYNFTNAYEAKQWDQAVLFYPKAFDGTAFESSSYGLALFGYTMFKAGLEVTGLEKLFQAANPAQLDELEELWVQAAPDNFYAWDLAKVKWTPAWTEVFGKEIEYQVKVQGIQSINSIDQLKALSIQSPAGSLAKARADWKLVLAYSMNDKADEAAKLLVQLMKNEHSPVSPDLMQLTAARLLFQNGYFDAAIRYYEKVDKKSEHWVEAQEEMAWAYIRKGQPQDAMAITKGLNSGVFNNQVRPEAYLVGSVAGLRICDYPNVVSTLEKFPKSFKQRTQNLEAIAKNQSTESLTGVISKLKVSKIQIQDLGKEADALPRTTARDVKLLEYAQTAKYFETEAAVAEKLYAKSLAVTGLQSYFEELNKSLTMKAQTAQAAGISRLRELAQTEVDETKAILKKMHIVEAEVIQQVALADTLAKNSKTDTVIAKQGTTGAKGSETLRFAASDELWLDEISNYKIDVKKACHAKR